VKPETDGLGIWIMDGEIRWDGGESVGKIISKTALKNVQRKRKKNKDKVKNWRD
jgi:hypothetical protein